jgi:hypothetical protein
VVEARSPPIAQKLVVKGQISLDPRVAAISVGICKTGSIKLPLKLMGVLLHELFGEDLLLLPAVISLFENLRAACLDRRPGTRDQEPGLAVELGWVMYLDPQISIGVPEVFVLRKGMDDEAAAFLRAAACCVIARVLRPAQP